MTPVGRARPDDSVRTGVAEVLVPIKIFTRKLIGRSRGGKAMFSCLSLMGVAQGTSSLSILKNGSTAILFQIIAHGIAMSYFHPRDLPESLRVGEAPLGFR